VAAIDRAALGRETVHPNDPVMKRVRAWVIRRDRGMCGICGHPGSDGVDHVVPLSECEVRGISPWQPGNLQAAHSKRPCQVCQDAALANGGQRAGYCNALRGSLSLDAARLKIARRTNLVVMGVRPDRPPATPGRAGAEQGEREW